MPTQPIPVDVATEPRRIQISEAEWRLMRVIWTQPGITSRTLIDTLLATTDWKVGTIKSLLSRLLQKGYIEKAPGTSPFQFHASISQEDATFCRLQEAMEPICTTQRAHYLARLLATNPLSQSDCQALIQQLTDQAATAPPQVNCQCPSGACQCHHHGHSH